MVCTKITGPRDGRMEELNKRHETNFSKNEELNGQHKNNSPKGEKLNGRHEDNWPKEWTAEK